MKSLFYIILNTILFFTITSGANDASANNQLVEYTLYYKDGTIVDKGTIDITCRNCKDDTKLLPDEMNIYGRKEYLKYIDYIADTHFVPDGSASKLESTYSKAKESYLIDIETAEKGPDGYIRLISFQYDHILSWKKHGPSKLPITTQFHSNMPFNCMLPFEKTVIVNNGCLVIPQGENAEKVIKQNLSNTPITLTLRRKSQ